MTASKIFLSFCSAFIFGIFLNSFFEISLIIILIFLIFALILISLFWQHKKIVILGLSFLFMLLGIWRTLQVEEKISKSELQIYNDTKETIILTGNVISEPDIREKTIKLKIGNCKLKINDNWQDVSGAILITTNRYLEYQYCDKLKITGKLKSPQNFEDFNYKDYLKKDGIYSLMDFPKIELLKRGDCQNFSAKVFSRILKIKNYLREVIEENLSPPQSAILSAMLLGDKRKISQEWKEKLNITGLRHITAISGLHVTVLTIILMNILLALGFWRQQAFYFAIIFLFFFILLTGLQPSAIRAGIMGGLFLLAQYLGRMNSSFQAIFFAGAIMLFQNPLLLKLDLGFQLSFLATLGIISLSSIFQDWLKFIPWQNIRSILAMTFSAYLFTLPILIYNFGYFSLVGLITNLLIVPTLYWIMFFGFIFVVVGLIFPFLAWLLSFLVFFLLSYLTFIVDIFSRLPFAALSFRNVHWLFLLIFYLILAIFTWRAREEQRLKFLKY